MNQETPYISVIVPFYNIEEYVDSCLASLVSQVFQDFELVLVDDGSTDSTRKALEEWVSRDSRVRLFSKKNGGLSDARNFGISKSRGRYITFVDGDDIVSPYYLKHMADAAKRYPNALIVDGFVTLTPETSAFLLDQPTGSHDSSCLVLDRKGFFEQFSYNSVTESAWGKLAPRDAYGERFFPEGALYEDLATLPQLLERFSEYVVLPSSDYGYMRRSGSIVRCSRALLKQSLDYQLALDKVVAWAQDSGDDIDEEGLVYRTCLTYLRMDEVLSRTSDNVSCARKMRRSNLAYVRASLVKMLKNPRIGAVEKMRLGLFAVSPKLCLLVQRAYLSIADSIDGEGR